jgi:hypothetical protein
MTTIAALLLCTAGVLAQDETKAESALTDAELGVLGGFAADQVDAAPEPAALEKSILEKIDAIRKARTSGEKKEASSGSKAEIRKKRKEERQQQRKKKTEPADAIKNGLTESDRSALGKFVVSEISAGHKGEEFSAALKKELERIRSERVKSSSTPEPKKRKKKQAEN